MQIDGKGAAWMVAVALGCLQASPSLAHHSFSAEFSRDLPIEVTGIVSKVEWTNPHARFYVEAEDENGERVTWDFELTTPNLLMRKGWKRDSLKPGDEVTVTGWRARNAPHVGNAASVTLKDGRKLFTGSAGSD
ncbi:MAG TPA: DUF6152 family protein [Gammaproteobacteria bacterium]